MNTELRILGMLEEVNMKLDLLTNGSWEMNIPNASQKLGICEARLRADCEGGKIPCHPKNAKAKKIHWMVDIVGARKYYKKGGELVEMMQKHKIVRRRAVVSSVGS